MFVPRPHLALAFLFLLAGCRGLPEDTLAEPQDVPDTLAFADDEVDEGPTLGLALRRTGIGSPYEISLANQSQVILTDLYYDGLVEALEGELVPALAESWEANEDFTRWTFHLAPGQLTAADVAASFEGLLADNALGQATLLLGHVTTVVASDDQTVVFELERPDAGLAWLLSGVRYSVEGPNGAPTGRYEVEEVDADHTRFRAEGRLDVLVSWADTAAESLELLYGGTVDAALVDNADFPVAAEEFGDPGEERSVVRFYVANLASPDMADPASRKLIMKAVDKARAASFGPTIHSVSKGLLPGPIAEFQGLSVPKFATVVRGTEEDLSNVRIVVGYVAATQSPIAESIVSDIRAAGFDAVRQQFSPEELAVGIESGQVDIFAFGLAAESASIDSVIPPLLWSKSAFNPARLANERIDGLIEEALETRDDTQRWELLNEAVRTAENELVVIPISTLNSGLIWANDESDRPPLRPDGSIEIESAE